MLTTLFLSVALLFAVFHFTGSIHYALFAWVAVGLVMVANSAFNTGGK